MTAVAGQSKAFARALTALGPYLDDLVVVGGWAHRLYEHHPRGRSPGFDPLMTEDADIAAPARMATKLARKPASKGDSIADLLKRAGFQEGFFGDEQPPVSHYHLGNEEDAFYIEFLVPLTGSGYRRDGTRDATTTVAGVTAQKLRHVDILVTEPWVVGVSAANGFPVGPDALEVRIANPVSYLAQKILVLPERKPDKQAKDMLYIHDTLLILGAGLDGLAPLWKRVAATQHPSVLKKLADRRAALFAAVTDRARGAARIAASTGRADPPSAETLVAASRLGLGRIFG